MSTLAPNAVFGGRLSVFRCTAVGAIVLGVLFVLCWLGAAVGLLNVSHMYVALFSIGPVSSTATLAGGLGWSLVFGGLAGALTALAYNALAFLER